MHFYIPEMIFGLLVISGTPPRAAMIASDAILYPVERMLDHARSYPCVVHVDDAGVGRLVEGPPEAQAIEHAGPPRRGFETWNCWTRADPGIVHWRLRGVSRPFAPWRTAWYILHARTGRDVWFWIHSDLMATPFVNMPIPLP